LAHYCAFSKGASHHDHIFLEEQFNIDKVVFGEQVANKILEHDLYKYGMIRRFIDCENLSKMEKFANIHGLSINHHSKNSELNLKVLTADNVPNQ
jgi:hypothetical protein